MSSGSESEIFYDASEISPEKTSSILPGVKKKNEVPLETITTWPNFQKQSSATQFSVQMDIKTSASIMTPFASSNAVLSPPLTNKLGSSLPTLHLQDTQPPSTASAFFLEKKSLNEEVNSMLMPPPKEPPLKYDDAAVRKKGPVEESASVCSESLLETLSSVGEMEVKAKTRRRVRRDRQVKSRTCIEDDDDSAHPSTPPPDSPASSVDAFPSSQKAPFRVVEIDATSIYSTTYSIEKGSRQNQEQQDKALLTTLSSGADNALPSETLYVPPKLSKEAVKDESGGFKESTSLTFSPEPDIVASTKSNSLPREGSMPESLLKPAGEEASSVKEVVVNPCSPGEEGKLVVPPVAPPRRKRHRKQDPDSLSTVSVCSLQTPPMSLVTKDFDTISRHMDMQEASQGNFIVSPQDNIHMKGCDSQNFNDSRLSSDSQDIYSTPSADIRRDQPGLIRQIAKSVVYSRPGGTSAKEGVVSSHGDSVRLQKISAASTKSDAPSLTDEEILKQVSVLNLDTGERIPLSDAENCLPPALNPLSLHIMRLTHEYNSSKSGVEDVDEESEEENGSLVDVVVRKLPEVDPVALKKKTSQLKKLLGRRVESAVSKAKTLANKGKDDKDVFEDDTPAQNTMQYVKIKTSHGHKGPPEFDNLMYVQELIGEHTGPIWCMKFSSCGRLLATAGQDHVLRVWVLKQAFSYFLDIRTKWNADVKCSPSPSQESLVSQHSSHSNEDLGTLDPNDDGQAPFMPKPFCVYTGHTADVLDLSWSKNYFMLTSSMDKTVRLWHISRKECLCIFKHVDFVTAIAFHPKDDRYFISGSLDGKLRLWSIPDKQVVMWNEVEGQPQLITAANFCQNGTFIVVGTYNGRCIFYKTEELKYFTQIHVKSSRGKNSQGRKITGIEPLPEKNMLLITSNDSRIRLYDLSILNVACKYKGYSNFSSQIRAGFSHDGKFIAAGSENQCVYIWKTHHDYSKFSSARKDRNTYWEGVKAHSAAVTCAIFSPRPDHVFGFIEQQEELRKQTEQCSNDPSKRSPPKDSSNTNKGYVMVSADFNGCIKVFLKREKPKHSSLPASALA